MEVPIPFGAYTGPSTPLGGPSLEWTFSSSSLLSEPDEEDSRLSVGSLPTIILGVMAHIRRVAELYPRSLANVERTTLCVGVPIIENFVAGNPGLASRLDHALMSSGDDGLREFRIRSKAVYPFSLGPEERDPHSIYAKNKSYTSRVSNMSEDIGLTKGRVTTLCLVAGLAQSLDSSWVPLKWREAFIQEVQFFEKWLKREK